MLRWSLVMYAISPPSALAVRGLALAISIRAMAAPPPSSRVRLLPTRPCMIFHLADLAGACDHGGHMLAVFPVGASRALLARSIAPLSLGVKQQPRLTVRNLRSRNRFSTGALATTGLLL